MKLKLSYQNAYVFNGALSSMVYLEPSKMQSGKPSLNGPPPKNSSVCNVQHLNNFFLN